ncbi:group XIIB secretory phospholipase A2-like protein isoform X2 [Esox lucius]|uniref:group XIIB secretory phospholipase A2-like protein isoform X2 n=1 Tax=Esox lucius TaxID=8010 RepID=UPI0005775879|nr:group XIIB secretory phospholipase A2-like protein isoform X2 [Esox lucius]
MLPRTLSVLLLCLSLSSGMCASLVREKIPEEDIPTLETPVEVETAMADIPVAGTPVMAEPNDTPAAGPLVAVESIAEAVVAHEDHPEEPNVGSPDSDALAAMTVEGKSAHMEELKANTPTMEDTADVDLKSMVKETLRAEAMIQELSDQPEEQEGLTEDVEIQQAILRESADQDSSEEPGTKAPATPTVPGGDTQTEDSGWGLASIRDSLQATNGYFDSLVELMGGPNGVCQYVCKYGETPVHRQGYTTTEPNGCASDVIGFQFDLGIPAMTQCCNQLDSCYDTCGSIKHHCDTQYRWCLHAICSDLKKSLGFVSKVKACESVADTLYSTVWTLGCRSFMNSQREACYCEGEDRDEL